MNQRGQFVTNIESEMKDILEKNKISFCEQYSLRGSFILDFAIFDDGRKICIECDGETWHTKKRDSMKTALLKKEGWIVLRFKGNKILQEKKNVECEILEVLKNG